MHRSCGLCCFSCYVFCTLDFSTIVPFVNFHEFLDNWNWRYEISWCVQWCRNPIQNLIHILKELLRKGMRTKITSIITIIYYSYWRRWWLLLLLLLLLLLSSSYFFKCWSGTIVCCAWALKGCLIECQRGFHQRE